ncbi:MAG: hypothetical protein GYB65_23800 [Chloroflexi bacterium]|nr:hypothetical protein [Chloroflexota bacterium]
MKKAPIIVCGVVLAVLLVATFAFGPRASVQNLAEGAAVFLTPTVPPSETPGISEVSLPTALPTMAGPMGTLTAIADLVATPEDLSEPYEIELQGRPHFIEFHAWW